MKCRGLQGLIRKNTNVFLFIYMQFCGLLQLLFHYVQLKCRAKLQHLFNLTDLVPHRQREFSTHILFLWFLSLNFFPAVYKTSPLLKTDTNRRVDLTCTCWLGGADFLQPFIRYRAAHNQMKLWNYHEIISRNKDLEYWGGLRSECL